MLAKVFGGVALVGAFAAMAFYGLWQHEKVQSTTFENNMITAQASLDSALGVVASQVAQVRDMTEDIKTLNQAINEAGRANNAALQENIQLQTEINQAAFADPAMAGELASALYLKRMCRSYEMGGGILATSEACRAYSRIDDATGTVPTDPAAIDDSGSTDPG